MYSVIVSMVGGVGGIVNLMTAHIRLLHYMYSVIVSMVGGV